MFPSFGIFNISWYFPIRQIQGCWFQIWQQLFQIPAQNTKIWHFFPKFKDFYFCTKLCNNTNSRMLIWNTAIIFSNSSPKICKLDIFGTKFKDFYFASNFSIRQIQGRWFQIWQWLFRILARKYSNKAFFVLNVSIF